jgi:hypothetical protein
MAGKKPGLITGSNAKIVLGGRTLAYATDIQYSVETSVIPVEVMGRMEVMCHEPIAINVSGSFSVVRYTSFAKTNGLPDTATNGNGVGQLAAGGTNLGDMSNAFNPGAILSTSTVDLQIYQRQAASGADTGGTTAEVIKISDCRLTRLSGSINKRGILVEQYQFVGIMYDDESFTASNTTTGTDLE